jgi:transmembrane sensor
MSDRHRAIDEEAIDWLIRQRDEQFSDWSAFEAWLSTSPDHLAAYAGLAGADRALDDVLPALGWPRATEPVIEEARPTRRYWLGGAIAASLAVAVGSWTLWPSRDLYTVQTAAGERRTIQLAGSRIEVNGGTRLTLDRRDPRFASLDRGQAVFIVTHDKDHPFRVVSADATLLDAGTTFEVTRDDGGLDVAVSEGLVIFNPNGQALRVPAGRRLVDAKDSETIAVAEIKPSDVGAWRDGQLVYDGAPLSRVAADLERNLGVKVAVTAAAARMTFRGVVRLDGGAEPTMNRLGALLGVTVTRSGEQWMIAGP